MVADSEAIKKHEALETLKRRNYLTALRKVMETAEGRHVLWELMRRSNLFRECLSDNSHYTHYNLGKRDFAVGLYRDIMEQSGDLFRQAQSEHCNVEEEPLDG